MLCLLHSFISSPMFCFGYTTAIWFLKSPFKHLHWHSYQLLYHAVVYNQICIDSGCTVAWNLFMHALLLLLSQCHRPWILTLAWRKYTSPSGLLLNHLVFICIMCQWIRVAEYNILYMQCMDTSDREGYLMCSASYIATRIYDKTM